MNDPKDQMEATGADLDALLDLVGAPGRVGEGQGMDELLFGVQADLRAEELGRASFAARCVGRSKLGTGTGWEKMPESSPVVRTEPVLRDPRPMRVRIHGKEYHLHRVVHGQVLGCSSVDAQPGTILPPALYPPTRMLDTR